MEKRSFESDLLLPMRGHGLIYCGIGGNKRAIRLNPYLAAERLRGVALRCTAMHCARAAAARVSRAFRTRAVRNRCSAANHCGAWTPKCAHKDNNLKAAPHR